MCTGQIPKSKSKELCPTIYMCMVWMQAYAGDICTRVDRMKVISKHGLDLPDQIDGDHNSWIIVY